MEFISRRGAICISVACFFLSLGPAFSAEKAVEKSDAVKLGVVVVTLNGKGTAKVRHKAGTESILGVKQLLLAGDRITTDEAAVVQLMLPDGSLVRVGTNTEYRIDSAQVKNGIVEWVFNLTRGTIRAMVEKTGARRDAKFRVNTPAGTMGVRGTELMLEHTVGNETTTLYTVEGKVSLGSLDCDKKKSCVLVLTGQTASIRKGEAKPSAPTAFSVADLARLTAKAARDQSKGAGKALSAAELEARLSVMLSLGGLGKDVKLLDDEALKKMAEHASQQLSDMQDALLNRSAATRKAMEQAAADGSYQAHLALGELSLKAAGSPLATADPADILGAANTRKFEAAAGEIGKANASQSAAASQLAAAGKPVTVAAVVSAAAANSASAASSSGASLSNTDIQQRLHDIQAAQDSYAAQAGAAYAGGATTGDASALVAAGDENMTRVQAWRQHLNDTSAAVATGTSSVTNGAPATVATSSSPNTSTSVSAPPSLVNATADKEVAAALAPLTPTPCKAITGVLSFFSHVGCEITKTVDSVLGITPKASPSSSPAASSASNGCYDYKRECTTGFVPCDLSSGKACKGKVTTSSCKDVRYQVQCR